MMFVLNVWFLLVVIYLVFLLSILGLLGYVIICFLSMILIFILVRVFIIVFLLVFNYRRKGIENKSLFVICSLMG